MQQIAKEHLLKAFDEVSKDDTLSMDVKDDTLSMDVLDARRAEFTDRYPPDALPGLIGSDLMNFFHGDPAQPKTGLFYDLEFGEIGQGLGSISGGSSLKFKVYRAADGSGFKKKGPGNAPVPCSDVEAERMTMEMARTIYEAYTNAAKYDLASGDQAGWSAFAKEVAQAGKNDPLTQIGNDSPPALLAWGHKYLAICCPNLFSFHHQPKHLASHLVRLGETPVAGNDRYLLDWQWLQLRKNDQDLSGMHPILLMKAAYKAFGSFTGYWRVGTDEHTASDVVDRWEPMRRGESAKKDKSDHEAKVPGAKTALADADTRLKNAKQKEQEASRIKEICVQAKAIADSLHQQRTDERQKLENTQDSKLCGYCGQPISAKQWQEKYETAQRNESSALTAANVARQEWENAEAAVTYAKRESAEADQLLNTKQSEVRNLEAEIIKCQDRIDLANADMQQTQISLPSDWKLSLGEAERQIERLPDLQQANRWSAEMADAQVTYAHIEEQLSSSARAWRVKDAESLQEAARNAEEQNETRIGLVAKLPVCKQSVAEKKEALSEFEKQLSPELQALALQDLIEEQNGLSGAAEAIKSLRAAQSSVGESQGRIDSLRKNLSEIPERARRKLSEAEDAKRTAEKEMIEARKRQDDAVKKYDDLFRQSEVYNKLESELRNARLEESLWKQITDLLGENTLLAWLIDQAQHEIVGHANDALDKFSQNRLFLGFADSRHQTALNLVCHDALVGGEPLPLGNLSGSQRFRVAVCLALGIGRFAAKDSQKIQSVIIDEGFGSLDPDALREVSRELQTLNDSLGLERVIVVSHQESFADAFSNRFRIKMSEEVGSFIEN